MFSKYRGERREERGKKVVGLLRKKTGTNGGLLCYG